MKVKDRDTGKIYSVGIAQSAYDYYDVQNQKMRRQEVGDYVIYDAKAETYTTRSPQTLEDDFIVIEGWDEPTVL